MVAAVFSLLASVWRKSENRKSSTPSEFLVSMPKEDVDKLKNYDDIMFSKEQTRKLMSNDAQ